MIALYGKTALITGGSRGIGRATALLLAEAGADVAFTYREHKTRAEAVVKNIQMMQRKAFAYRCDVSDFDAVGKTVEQALADLGKIDFLVNNAGIWKYAPIDQMTPDQWRETLAVNLDGVFYFTRRVVPHMKARKTGRIVHIASTAGQRGEPFHSHYAASKGAIIAFTKSLAAELADDGILVNCVAPGWVDTEMSEIALKEQKNDILRTIPLKRPGRPEEIAGAVLFLVSEYASYVTGEILNVNGGSVLCG